MTTRMYVTCPSYAIGGPADRAGVLRRAQAWADALGWQVVASPLLARYLGPGAWLPAEERVDDMRIALGHEVIWACRGGYAAVHLAPALLELPAAGRPLLIGYSDTTVLHACWRRRQLGPALYGSLPDSLGESRQADGLRAWLGGQDLALSGASEAAAQVLRPGEASGELFAACLVVLASLCGTPAMPSLRGAVLAIEDVSERPYAIDFALSQLHMSGALEGVAALLCGSFSHENPADYGGPSVEQVLRQWAERLGVPTIARLPFGHLDDQLALPAGARAEVSAGADGRWQIALRQR